MKTQMHIHAVREDWPNLRDVPGIKDYWNRSLMLSGGTCLVHARTDDPDLQLLLNDYRDLGLGPRQVVFVKPRSDSFYADILGDPAALSAIRAHVSVGGKLDLFCSSPPAGEFVKALGLDWNRHTANPSLEAYQVWRDKRTLRQILGGAGFKNLFPAHGIAKSREELVEWAAHFAHNGASGTMYKRGDGATSEAMQTVPKGNMPTDSFMQAYWNDDHGLIVEAAYEHDPFSITFLLEDDRLRVVNSSLQWMGQGSQLGDRITMNRLLEGNMSHRGNLVGPSRLDLGPIPRRVIYGMTEALRPALELARQQGLRGAVCADCLHVRDELSFLVELNPRTSHSGYAQGIRDAMSNTLGTPLFALAANIKVGGQFQTYAQARDRLPNRMDRRRKSGTLMYHTPLLPFGKAGLIAFGETYEETVQAFYEAEAALVSR